MTQGRRVPLYERIPEVYRIEDEKQIPPGQLRAFLELVEDAFGEIHKNIESLYHQFFIETCDDWAVPYIGDLLGVTPLGGDPRFSRRDVANTIALRRRKGTLGAIELLTEDLTGWGAHATELFHDLAWSQPLNHQRPDAGGLAPYALPSVDRHTVVRGGTAALRDPSTLALLGSPFDPFAHLPDFRPTARGQLRLNLPNLAVFLWRLEAYRVTSVKPVFRGSASTGISGAAARVVRFDLHPLGDPIRLFNNGILDSEKRPALVTDADVKPGPIHRTRLDSMRPPLHRGSQEPGTKAVGDLWFDTDTRRWKEWDGSVWKELPDPIVEELVSGGYGRPAAYAEVVTVGGGTLPEDSDLALQFFVPRSAFPDPESNPWTFRGANLMAWEQGLRRPLDSREIAIDPQTGRVAIGVNTANQADRLRRELRITHTYGAVGPVGAHPIDRSGSDQATFQVDGSPGKRLRDALAGIETVSDQKVVIEIGDNDVHDLSVGAVSGAVNEVGGPTLVVGREVVIRAGDGKRPIVRLDQPLRLRAKSATGAGHIKLTLEGLHLTRGSGWTAGDALIERSDIGHLILDGCTLDPGGTEICPGAGRQPIHPALRLRETQLIKVSGDPEVQIRNSIVGPLLLDPGYVLTVESSIVDAGSGVHEEGATAGLAIRGTGPLTEGGWGPRLRLTRGSTFFGRVRVTRASGIGGIWTQTLEVLDNQTGCIKFSYFTGRGDRLPPIHACVSGAGAEAAFLRFVSEIYGQPGYGQLSLETDFRIRERGPHDDEMGAFGFQLDAHKWRNLQLRYREFMPVGVRPLLVPVT